MAKPRSSKHLHRIARTGLVFSFLLLWAFPAVSAETGTIRGRIVDDRGRVTFVGNAVVFLCDAQSGLPIVAGTKQPLELREESEGIKGFWHAVTTDRGDFEFADVPAGKYRLVAQSWSGTKGLPEPQQQPSTIVVLHGVAENVEVKAGQVADANPRKLGDGILKIVNDPEEAHAFLLISRKPRLGEGVLGPTAWGPEFLSGLIGVTQMEKPYVTLVGLPDGKDIHVGLFNYDNNPGVGGDTYTVGKENVVRLDIYATWSNGKHEPPKRLLKLTEHLEKENLSVSEILGLPGKERENEMAIVKLFRNDPDQKIEIKGVGTFPLADVLAASTFRELRKSHRARRKR